MLWHSVPLFGRVGGLCCGTLATLYLCLVVILLFALAYFNDLVVGGVCCRVEIEGDRKRLYIMTLGVLAPYRRLGIGINMKAATSIVNAYCVIQNLTVGFAPIINEYP